MDAIPFVIAVLAVFGFVAAIAGVESRDGFDRDAAFDGLGTRTH